MSAEYVRSHYGVDYKLGDRITVDGKPGTIVSFPGQYLGVRFDGSKLTVPAHPTWRVARTQTPPSPVDPRPRATAASTPGRAHTGASGAPGRELNVGGAS